MRRDLDRYLTDLRVTRALLDRVPISGTLCEPCVGEGHIPAALRVYGRGITEIVTNDIDPLMLADFHEDATVPSAAIWQREYDWVVTNPSFKIAPHLLPLAFARARVGIAMLLRLSYLEPARNRGAWLQANRHALSDMIIFNPRPSFTDDGKTDSVTVAWLVWRHGWQGGCQPDFVTDWNSQ